MWASTRLMPGEAVAVSVPVAVGRDDGARLAALFDAHYARLYRLARRLARNADDARDLIQETFLRAARAPASVPEGTSSEEAWLVRVLINICRDGWRRSASRMRLDPHHDAARPVAPADPESAIIARSIVQQALQRLPPRRRAILVLYELEGAPISEIARMLGVAPVTVRWHLSMGRREMARAITSLGVLP